LVFLERDLLDRIYIQGLLIFMESKSSRKYA